MTTTRTLFKSIQPSQQSFSYNLWRGDIWFKRSRDFTVPDVPKFWLMCTLPQTLSEIVKRNYASLNLPSFYVPTEPHLRKRSTLDCYLSQALGLTLHERNNGEMHLQSIDDHEFILTLLYETDSLVELPWATIVADSFGNRRDNPNTRSNCSCNEISLFLEKWDLSRFIISLPFFLEFDLDLI